MYNIVIIKYR